VWDVWDVWDVWGMWEQIWRAAVTVLVQQDRLDWSMAFLGGPFVPAKQGGEKVGLTWRDKGALTGIAS
jgi:hypothetical protein